MIPVALLSQGREGRFCSHPKHCSTLGLKDGTLAGMTLLVSQFGKAKDSPGGRGGTSQLSCFRYGACAAAVASGHLQGLEEVSLLQAFPGGTKATREGSWGENKITQISSSRLIWVMRLDAFGFPGEKLIVAPALASQGALITPWRPHNPAWWPRPRPEGDVLPFLPSSDMQQSSCCLW